ncbi:MAG: hypothetical protein HUJ26_22950 [Planctomycetaceae bacterium]|nr:hypothetical protein [Planctomycetaceae bacterium]
MSRQSILTIVIVIASIWCGSLAWLSGYKQGYSEGSETAWENARNALGEPIPVLNIDPVEISSVE